MSYFIERNQQRLKFYKTTAKLDMWAVMPFDYAGHNERRVTVNGDVLNVYFFSVFCVVLWRSIMGKIYLLYQNMKGIGMAYNSPKLRFCIRSAFDQTRILHKTLIFKNRVEQSTWL